MPLAPFKIVGTFSKSRQKGINAEETYNMYLVNEQDEVTPPALITVPGNKKLFDFPAGTEGRAQYTYQGNNYCVVSDSLYRIDPTLGHRFIGRLLTDTGFADIQGNNSNQIMIIDGAYGYIYNVQTNIFERITDPNFPLNPTTLAFAFGRFIVNGNNQNTQRNWYLSNLNNGLVWNALEFAQMQYQYDKIIAIAVNRGLIYIFGEFSAEVWVRNPNPQDFQFIRDENMLFEFGTAALGSVVQGLDMLFWLSRNREGVASIMMTTGGYPVPISNIDVDQEINNYTTVSDARAYIMRENGYEFYCINFTSANVSWLYNITNKTWTKMRMRDGLRHFIQTQTDFMNKDYGLSYRDGGFYEIATKYQTFNGENKRKERVSARYFDPALRDSQIYYAELDCVHGDCDIDVIPKVEIAISPDEGRTYTDLIPAEIGRIGNFIEKTYWEDLGIYQSITVRIISDSDIDLTIRGMSIGIDVVGAG